MFFPSERSRRPPYTEEGGVPPSVCLPLLTHCVVMVISSKHVIFTDFNVQ